MSPPLLLTLVFLLAFIRPSKSNPTDIFILAGQSNMAGRGGVCNNVWDGVIPPQCRPNPSIRRFSASLAWEEAHEPLHADIDVYGVCGVGPGMSFANAVRSARMRGPSIGLVPCAVGSSGIDDWSKGGRLYGGLIGRARAAVAAAAGGGRIRAVLWYQGERDAVSAGAAWAYRPKMERFIRDLRLDLGLPSLLFIQVAIATGQGPYKNIVRAGQKSIRMPNVVTVDALGLRVAEDYVHLTTQAQVQLGWMLASAYLSHSRPAQKIVSLSP
ncbi:putative carbohydrate esterase [Acorus calamus]|uniref:Carbohydrate esterase n=2 Tax=Acorus calamus TaxID=4465 RepID=A0AAV9DVL8_ACOCL|nr:putative carbohydrate esterase [Acorus calamus]